MDGSMKGVQQSFAGLSSSSVPSIQQQGRQKLLFSNSFNVPSVDTAQCNQTVQQYLLGMNGEMNGIGGKRPTGIPPSHPNTASYFSQVAQPDSSPTQQPPSNINFFPLEPLASMGSASPFSSHLSVSGMELSKSQPCPSNSATGVPPLPFQPSGSGPSFEGLPPSYRGHRRSFSEVPYRTTELFSNTKASVTSFSPRRSDVDSEDELMAFISYGGSDASKSDNGHRKLMTFDNGVHGMRNHEVGGSTESSEGSINEIVALSNKDLLGFSSERKEGLKRSAPSSPDIHIPSSRHLRSLSVDSIMGKLNFGTDSLMLSSSSGGRPALRPRDKSVEFSLDFGNGEFTPAEMEKIMSNTKLTEIAISDPKRAKRILNNRQSAARSKEKKMKYISELEGKVQTLQDEASTLSAQVSMLQRDNAGLVSHNNELQFRLQAMDQQAQLRNALNETLTAEVHRLKLATGEISGNQQFPSTHNILQINQQQKRPQQEGTGSAITMESEANSATAAAAAQF